MNKHAKKHWTARRKVLVAMSIIILVGLIAFSKHIVIISRVISLQREVPPRTSVASTTAELNQQAKRWVEKDLPWGVKIPDSAKEIYINLQFGGPDSWGYCSMTLPEEDFTMFAEKFAGVPISEFKDGCAPARWTGGPPPLKRGWKSHYWNITDVKNGKHYYFDGDFIGIDLDTNRVYLRVE